MSPSPSFEGDDEYSSAEELDDMVSERGDLNYADEDTRPTSRKELAGWYSYGWAAEVFVICAMGSFLPITLEQLARDQGVLLDDKSKSCTTSWKSPGLNSDILDLTTSAPPKKLAACVIYILGVQINTASFAMYTFSLSVLVQSLLIVSMSGAADHGRFRKTYLIVFAVVGSMATMLFLAVIPRIYLLGSLLAIIANTCFGASFVLLNSYIPLLVRYHPSVQAMRSQHDRYESPNFEYDRDPSTETEHDDHMVNSTTSLLPANRSDTTAPMARSPAAISPALALSTRISSYGVGIGYAAALIVQILAISLLTATGRTTFSLRLVLFVVGAWWFVFTLPAALWLRPRPGPPLPALSGGRSSWFSYITFSWKALFRTIGRARKLKDILIFLSAWFLLSDGIATVSGTSVLYAKTNLGMQPEALGLIGIIATIFGLVGALYWSSFSRFFNLRASQTIVACLCLFETIPLYGLLGFIPAVQRLGWLGLQQPVEIYILAAVYGLVVGGLSSYCRSFFGELIPPGFEAAFYALYAITDKGSSVFGPAIVGLITDRYGDIRPSFFFLAVLIFSPLPLMLLVDVDRGKAEAAAMAVELKEAADNHAPQQHATIPQIRLPEDDDL